MEITVRASILLGCAALLLGGCGGGNQSADNGDNAIENLTADVPPAGDTTAIDAATGADANMAADAEIPPEEADSNATANVSNNSD